LQDGRVPFRRSAAIGLAVIAVTWSGGASRAVASEPSRMACAEAPPPLPPVRLHLIDRAGLSGDARDTLMRDALAPWQAIGARVAWATAWPSTAPALGAPHDVYVTIDADADTRRTRLPMASILFVAGRPTTQITVHAGYVARRLATIRLGDERLADRPRLVRDRVLGRVLGRAVAHELGHYLLGSSAHAPHGLMRASHRIEHLLAESHPMFAVALPATPACLVARF
jgi:hypothetical protein